MKPAKNKSQKKSIKNIPEKKFWRQNIIPSLIIFFTGIILYAGTVSFKYILDDKMIITDNVFTNAGISGIGKIFSEESFTGFFQSQQNLVAGSRYRPLSIATFAAEMSFFKTPKEDGYDNIQKDVNGNVIMSGNPHVSHIVNAILYALTGLLLFRLLALMFPPGETKWFLAVPFAGALLFISHPVHTEVVSNIKSRDEILALLFSLASMYYLLSHYTRKNIRALLFGIFSFFLALLSKESALSFLIIIPLTIYFFTKKDLKIIWKSALPLLAVSLLYLMIRVNVIGHLATSGDVGNLMNNPFYGMDMQQKLATIIYTLGIYLKLMFIPHPLTNDYYPYAIPVMSFSDARVLFVIIIIALLLFFTIKGFRKKNVVSYSIMIFAAGLILVSNIFFPVGSFMNERFAYVSSIAFSIAIPWLLILKLPELFPGHKSITKFASVVIIAIVAITFSILTLIRIPAWRNNYTLFETDVKTSSASAFSNCFVGVGYYYHFLAAKDDELKKEFLVKADAYLHKALSIYPEYDEALHNLSGVVVKEFEYDKDFDKLLNTLGSILSKKNKSEYIDNFLSYMNGQEPYRKKMLGFYHKTGYDILYRQEKKADKALKYIQMGLQIDPSNETLNKDLNEINSSSFAN